MTDVIPFPRTQAGWIHRAWYDQRLVLAVMLGLSLVASITKYAKRHVDYDIDGRHYSDVRGHNNYMIFTNAARHLAAGQPLYQYWPAEQFELYKYSPTFAAMMWPLARMPEFLGLCLFNALGVVALWYALVSLPLPERATAGICWLMMKDLLTSLQNVQANALMAAFMIGAVAYWERNRLAAAAVALALSFYIKIFGVAAIVLCLMYPHKLRFAGWAILMGGVLAAVPLLITTPESLASQYAGWLVLLKTDHAASLGDSVMGMLQACFGTEGHKLPTVALGAVALLAPLARISQYGNIRFRLGMLASVLMWVVLFNHRAESPTFVIATCGVAIWFCSRPITKVNAALMAMTVLLSGFASSDLFPEWLRTNLIGPYHLKALPSLLVWLKLQAELWRETEDGVAAIRPCAEEDLSDESIASIPYRRAA